MAVRRKFLVGADPELFVTNPNSGEFRSAHDLVPGTKHEPFKVPYGAVQVDGTALEFNIDPAANVEEFVRNINAVRQTLTDMVPGYNVIASPVAVFEPDYFKYDVPSSAQELGCMPDFCGWTQNVNPKPDPDGKPFRTASGHLHIGWTEGADEYDKDHFLLCCKIARQLDFYLGMYSLLWDDNPIRRSLYGQAGAFRPKSYGLEYRVLSNRWLDSEPIMRWIYQALNIALTDAFNNVWAEDLYGDLAQQVINNNIVDWQAKYPDFDLGLEALPA